MCSSCSTASNGSWPGARVDPVGSCLSGSPGQAPGAMPTTHRGGFARGPVKLSWLVDVFGRSPQVGGAHFRLWLGLSTLQLARNRA